MSTYKSIFTTLHHIDISDGKADAKEIRTEDLESYIKELIDIVYGKPEDSVFDIQSDTTEVISQIKKAVTEETNYTEIAQKIADRLLRTENQAQEKYEKFKGLQKGSLIQAYICLGDIYFYLIAKVEHSQYLDETDFLKKVGLAYKKHILKTCLIKFTPEKEISEIVVSDSNATVAAYWWSDFLELKKLNSDEGNTNKAFTAIELQLSSTLKDKAPYDYRILRNNLICYFRTQTQFVFENMLESVFGAYEPDEPNKVNMEKIKESVSSLPARRKFDRSFNIKPELVKAHMRRTYSVNSSIDISINGDIPDNMIKAGTEDNGEKYLKIKTNNDVLYKMYYK